MDLQQDAKLQHSLKIEVEGLKSQNTELQKSLEDKTLEAEKCETAFRSEVSLPISNDGSKDSTTTPTSSSKHKNLGLVRYEALETIMGDITLLLKFNYAITTTKPCHATPYYHTLITTCYSHIIFLEAKIT